MSQKNSNKIFKRICVKCFFNSKSNKKYQFVFKCYYLHPLSVEKRHNSQMFEIIFSNISPFLKQFFPQEISFEQNFRTLQRRTIFSFIKIIQTRIFRKEKWVSTHWQIKISTRIFHPNYLAKLKKFTIWKFLWQFVI